MEQIELKQYAVIELMGHQKMVGEYSEVTIAGKGFLRVSLLDKDGNPIRTRDINPDSIYAINPISRDTCLLEAGRNQQQPSIPYDLEAVFMRRIEAGKHADSVDNSVWG